MSQDAGALTPLRRALLALQQMQAKLDAVREREREPIAVIGLACRFPGAPDAEAYWRLLQDGADAVTTVPRDRWDADAYYDSNLQAAGKMVTRQGGFLAGVDQFDAAFFSIAPREAIAMDPQQRLLLEVAAEAFEHAGQPPARLTGSKTGVFIGISTHDYSQLQTTNGGLMEADAYTGTGNAFSVAAGRISYVFGLEGPSVALDTACSSSLVAVHLACQSLRLGESEMAVAGGVNLMLSPFSGVAMSKLGALSPDGCCRTFDAAANGYVRAEGCGLVMLKRLRDAERDGDRIVAIVRGSAVSQDGRSSGLTVPNGPAQEAVLREALVRANVDPKLVSYIEAHGTGTPLGDPIEIEAICRVLGRERTAGLYVGSVKTNFGHAEGAAGIAGLLKVILALSHRRIPAHLHLTSLNPYIQVGSVPLRIPAETIDWAPVDGRRIAGVSSFGFSGTNAHAVIEEAPDDLVGRSKVSGSDGAPYVLPLSARDGDALQQLSAATARWIESDAIHLDDAMESAWRRRAHYRHRMAAVGLTRAELVEALATHARGESSTGLVAGVAPAKRPKVVFVFPGQGSQWQTMGARLFESEPVFRESVERCRTSMRGVFDHDIVALLCEPVPELLWSRAELVQPLLFTMQVSLAALLRSWGIEPDAVIGHSLGEVAAAHVSGALSLDDASRIICVRSRLVQRAAGGRMAVVELSSSTAEEAVRPYAGRVALAAVNGPDAVLVAGDEGPIAQLLERLAADGTFCRLVDVDYASHSPHMDPLLGEIRDELRGVRPSPASVTMISTVTAQPVDGGELDAAYWATNLRQPVLFFPALDRLAREGHRIFLEISPHPILSHSVERALRHGSHEGVALAAMRRDQDPVVELYRTAAALHTHGVSFEAGWQRRTGARAIPLPPHPWRRERYWIAPPAREAARAPGGHPLLGHPLALAGDREVVVFETEVSLDRVPYLKDHRVEEAIVLAGAAYVEMALSAARAIAKDTKCMVEELALIEAMTFAEAPRTVQTSVERSGAAELSFQVASRNGDGPWTTHARARLRVGQEPPAPHDSLTEVKLRCSQELNGDLHYEALSARGLVYGPAFRGVRSVWRGGGEALGEIRLPDAAGTTSGYVIHPALLDACLQLFAIAGDEVAAGPAVPVAIRAVRLHGQATNAVWAHAQLRTTVDPAGAEGDVVVFDGEGQLLLEVRGLRAKLLEHRSSERGTDAFVAYEWREAPPLAEIGAVAGSYLLLADGGGTAIQLAHALKRAGASVDVVPPAELAPSMLAGRTAVVQLSSLDCPTGERTDLRSLDEARARDCRALLEVIQRIARDDARDKARIWLITRGAQAVERQEISVGQAPLWGLARTVTHEHPQMEVTRIDLAANGGADEIELVLREIGSGDHEEEVAIRNGRRFVGRLVRRPPAGSAKERVVPASGRPFQLRIDRPGVLDRLALRQLERRSPAAGEVEIAVDFAALNFIDVLKALGVQPGQEGGPLALGAECAGRITQVGEGVHGLHAGDEVVALAAGAIGTHVTTSASFVIPRPVTLRAEDAAAAPVAFMTAWIALHRLAKLTHGERILIHSAAGGTGLAALEIATRIGAEVYATAGSDEKRAFLVSRGVRHVLDSRTLAFGDAIMRATGGRGVDVVLNSLSGEAIDRSFSVLARYGRFVELGKRDIYEDAAIRLGHFKRQLSYFAVDLASMVVDRPEESSAVFREVIDALAEGKLTPLPRTLVPVSKVEEAFRAMAGARHIGKLVIDLADPDARLTVAADQSRGIEGTVLITGGLGGLGLSVARRLVADGVRSLVLVGRRGARTAEQAEAVASLERLGAHVAVESVDVANRRSLKNVIDRIEADGPKLAGVVHAAGVLADALLVDQSLERFEAVMAPKIAGAWNLHTLTKDLPLDFFVLYSSAASLFGAPGQANYAAANAFLDALAHHRRALGLPALSINWGAFSDVGLAAASEARLARLGGLGVRTLTAAEGCDALVRLLESSETQIGLAPIDVRQWVSFNPHLATSTLLSELVRDAKSGRSAASDDALLARLRAAQMGDRRTLLVQYVVDQVAQVVRLERSRIDPAAPFKSLGIDSLMGLELRNRLESALGIKLSATLVWTYGDAESLGAYLATRLDASTTPASRPVPSSGAPPLPTDDDVERRLTEKLVALQERLG